MEFFFFFFMCPAVLNPDKKDPGRLGLYLRRRPDGKKRTMAFAANRRVEETVLFFFFVF